MPQILHDETSNSYLGMTVAALIFNEVGQVLLIKENYGKRRYGPPGGRIEAGESPKQAVIREALEEVCVQVQVSGLIGIYYFAWVEPWLACAFRCEIVSGQPAVPLTGEIAEVGWFDVNDLPRPLTILAPYAIADAVNGEYGIVRDIPPR
jgi:8-oxo-dGTP diphosphatase